MALIYCIECGKQISDTAPTCPHCGHPFKPAAPTPAPAKPRTFRTGCLILIIAFFGVSTCNFLTREFNQAQDRATTLATAKPSGEAGSPVIDPAAIAQQSASEASHPSPQKSWHPIASWTGSGIKTTEAFTVTGSQWRIAWDTRNTAQLQAIGIDGNFQIMVYEQGKDFLTTIAANVMGESKDSSMIHQGGTFYLTINSSQDWTVTIEEQR